MSPRPSMHERRTKEAFAVAAPINVPAPTNLAAPTIDPVTNATRLIVILLGAVSLSLLTILLLARVRPHWKQRLRNKASISEAHPAIGFHESNGVLVLESNISIDMIIDDGRTQSSGTEFDDLSEQGSLETIVSSVSATRLTFTIDNLPGLMRGGILERRGRGDLQCDTSAYYEVDKIATGTGPISGRFNSKRSVTRPVFGFNFQEITPPVGSPLWNRRMDASRPVCPGPLSHPPKLA